jgi:hypothetical protein
VDAFFEWEAVKGQKLRRELVDRKETYDEAGSLTDEAIE